MVDVDRPEMQRFIDMMVFHADLVLGLGIESIEVQGVDERVSAGRMAIEVARGWLWRVRDRARQRSRSRS